MKVTIHAAKGWQNTGFKKGSQSGSYFRIRASGAWKFRPEDKYLADADGKNSNSGAQDFSSWRSTEGKTNFPYSGKGGRLGQLVGRFGEKGEPFAVGSYHKQESSNVPANDTLWLCMNDDGSGDNSGSLEVELDVDDFIDQAAQRRSEHEEENDKVDRISKSGLRPG